MTVDLVAIAVAAADPTALARFWARALGWEVGRTTTDQAELLPGPTDPTSFGLEFRRRPATAKTGRNPIHFDLTSTSLEDQQRSVADLLAIGARPADVGQIGDEGHVVLADPEGNELCVIEPGNRFLSTCPRLGAVNGDGTRDLGLFYRDILGWPLVWDENEETAVQSPAGNGPKVTWSGPPLLPKSDHERLHLHVAPSSGAGVDDALELLRGRGATGPDDDQGCAGATGLRDVDGNRFCLVDVRHRRRPETA
jgi:catechol 2,3-dioxygenase-like lactoylglutathione lyase family enzyme